MKSFIKKSLHTIPILLYVTIILSVITIYVESTSISGGELSFKLFPCIMISILLLFYYFSMLRHSDNHLGILNNTFFYSAIGFIFSIIYIGTYLDLFETLLWYDQLFYYIYGMVMGYFGISWLTMYFGHALYEKKDVIVLMFFGSLFSAFVGVVTMIYNYLYNFIVEYDSSIYLQETITNLLLFFIGGFASFIFAYPRFATEYPKVFSKNSKINKEEIKYIAIDLDGTLLNDQHVVSEYNKKVLLEAQKRGIKIILCSGRGTRMMRDIAKDVNLYENEGYIVSYNGAKAYTLDKDGTEKLLFETDFTREETQLIYGAVGLYGRNYVTFSDNKTHARDVKQYIEKNGESDDYKLDDNVVGDNILKALIFDDHENIVKIFDEVKEKVEQVLPQANIFTSAKGLIEICPHSAAKGIGLKKLFDEIGAESKNLICFGDQNNDVSMFKYAKYSVSMKNATTNLRKISTHTTKSNIKNGVGVFINDNILN